MKWHHILDKQPKHGDRIIQIDRPWVDGHCTMGMQIYTQYGPWEDILEVSKKDGWLLDFWWISAEDFIFPDFNSRTPK